jgi:hypothetical protein
MAGKKYHGERKIDACKWYISMKQNKSEEK